MPFIILEMQERGFGGLPTENVLQMHCLQRWKMALCSLNCVQGRRQNPLVGGCKAEITGIYLVSKLLYCHRSIFIPMSLQQCGLHAVGAGWQA